MPTTASAHAKNGRVGGAMVGTMRLGPQAWNWAGLRNYALRHPALVSLLVFGAVAAVTRPATWNTPLFEDPAQNLYVGQAIFDGGAPYVDAANNKGPLTFLVYGLLGLLTGGSNFALKLTVLAATAVSALLVSRYVARYAGNSVGFLAGLAFALFASASDLLGYEPMTEVYGLVPMTGAWLLASRGGTYSAAAAGICGAFAAFMNPAFGIIVPIAGLELWRRGRENGTLLRLFGWATAGGLAMTAVVLVWLGIAGAIDDMLTQVLGHITGTVDSAAAPQSSQGFSPDTSETYRFITVPAGGLWIAAVVGSLLAWRAPRLRLLAAPALLWIVLTFLRVKVADYELFHQYLLALPGIALGFAAGIASIWGPEPRRRLATAALVLAVPVATVVMGQQWRSLQLPASERFGVGNAYALAEPVADFLQENTSSEDRIFVGGHNAQVYWLADRKAPTRFFDSFPVVQEQKYKRERDRALRENPPEAIVIMPNTGPDSVLRELVLRREYQLALDEGGARVYLRF